MKSCRSHAGFTLIEILVSLGVGMSVVLVVMAAMTSGARGYQAATRRIDAMVEARASLGILTDDLSTIRGGGRDEFGWVEEDERFQRIWFFTTKPVEAQDPDKAVGDICLVHYFTAVTPDFPTEDAPYSRKLYRGFVNSADVLDLLGQGQLSDPQPDTSAAEVVAFNVTRFLAKPYVAEEGKLSEWEEASAEEADLLEVELQVLDGDAAGALKTEQDWNVQTPLARQLIGDLEEEGSDRVHDFQLKIKIGREE